MRRPSTWRGRCGIARRWSGFRTAGGRGRVASCGCRTRRPIRTWRWRCSWRRDLHEALDMLERDEVIRNALGAHIYERFVEAKRGEWQEYIGKVSEWELERA